MNWSRYHPLFSIDSVTGIRTVVARMLFAVGVPLIGGVLVGHPMVGVAGGSTALFVTMSDVGETPRVRLGTMFAGWLAFVGGGTLGHLLGGTPNANETVVLISALMAGWASGAHPGIAAVTRYFAVATAAATGIHIADPDVLIGMLVGGTTAIAAVLAAWKWSGLPPTDNAMDWRAGVQRAFAGADAGMRYTVCYGAAAATALFAASMLGVSDAYWATLVVLMVMRREGTVSFDLTIQYAAGTLLGVLVAGMLLRWIEPVLALALLATLATAFARIGFVVNPTFGFMAFTMYLLFVVQLIELSAGITPHLLSTRIYDVGVGCLLAMAGTLAATWPRRRASSS
jgi:hypothetical protein